MHCPNLRPSTPQTLWTWRPKSNNRKRPFDRPNSVYDVHAADALLSKDFVLTAASDGTLRSKTEFLPMIGDKSDPLEDLEYEAMQIRVYGNTAAVLSTIHEKAYYSGKPVEFRGRRTAVWVQQNQRWVCVTIRTLPRFRQNSREMRDHDKLALGPKRRDKEHDIPIPVCRFHRKFSRER